VIVLINKFEIIGFHIAISSTYGSFFYKVLVRINFMYHFCVYQTFVLHFSIARIIFSEINQPSTIKKSPSQHVLKKHDKPKVYALGWYQNSWLTIHVCVLYRGGISWCSWILCLRWSFRIWYFGLWRHVFS